MAELTFWISSVLILYVYFGYPLLLYFLSLFKTQPFQKGSIQPFISIIIAVHNEEQRIKEKIEGTLALNYPLNKREIIIASDGSTDRTNDIIKSYKGNGVDMVAPTARKGKESVQWQAIQASRGEILIFSDVATTLAKDSLLQIVSNFHDPAVGCVSSEDRTLRNNGAMSGEGFYVKYEMFLRRLESQIHSLVGLSGSFFAVRRELCLEWSTALPSDFMTVINAVKHGYRAVSDSLAIGYYQTIRSERDEFQRKVRTVLRGIAAMISNLEILNPFRYGIFSIQMLSHKLLRWLVPLFMVIVLINNILLIGKAPLYSLLLAIQAVFYLLALCGLAFKRAKKHLLFKIPAFFTLVNASITVAWLKYIFGSRVTLWQPSQR